MLSQLHNLDHVGNAKLITVIEEANENNCKLCLLSMYFLYPRMYVCMYKV